MKFELAERLKKLPPYLFAEIDRKKKEAIAAGRDIINLGIGDPDTPTPPEIIEALNEAAKNPANHQYAIDNGSPEFRTAINDFMKKRYDLSFDIDTEIYPTIGSKEAIGHFPLAYVNEGDIVLAPQPGYPPYNSGTTFAGGSVFAMPLTEDNEFLPDLGAIPEDVAEKAKIMWLNYPNSPTGRIAPREFFEEAVAFCLKHNIILAHDAAYAEMVFEGRALSIFDVEAARECAIEFHSLSKTFNMTGWRVGWAVGAPELIAGLAKVKTNLDSGIFTAIQFASIAALENYDEISERNTAMYRERRDVFANALLGAGWKLKVPDSTFYVWARVPEGKTSEETATAILEEADVVMTPGNGFGAAGEGYVRAAMTVDKARIAEAAERILKIEW